MGPDLTVYVRGIERADDAADLNHQALPSGSSNLPLSGGKSAVGSSAGGLVQGVGPHSAVASSSGGGGAAEDEMAWFGGVEIRTDCSGVVVRVPMAEKGLETVVEEKTLRRLGFEVLEFVRGFEAGEARG